MAKTIIALALLLLVSCGGGGGSDANTPVKQSDKYYGLTFLGLKSASVDCSEVFQMLAGVERFAVSLLWKSFGDTNSCLLQLAKDPRPKSINIMLVNGVCLRKNNCDGLDSLGYDNVIEWAMDAYDTVLPFINPQDELILTPGLEDDLDVLDYKYIADQIRFYAPEAKIGRNKNTPQVSAADCADADYCELHNEGIFAENHADYGWSNDGYDLDVGGDLWSVSYQYTPEDVLGRVTDRLSGARIIYLWKASFNGLVGDTLRAVPPYQRTVTVSQHDREAINNLLKEIQDVH